MATCLMASPGWAQPGTTEESPEVRQLLQTLAERLAERQASSPQRKRVTQLGTMARSHIDEPQLVVRVYDLGDLFALAPSYPAEHRSDLSGPGGPVFPDTTTAQLRGTGGTGGMGMGMGGMGMGGMGGMWNVHEPTAAAASLTPSPRVLPQMFAPAGRNVTEARTSLDELIEAITSTIAPDQWDAVGGPCSIAPPDRRTPWPPTPPRRRSPSPA
jgi:hypothetical protein